MAVMAVDNFDSQRDALVWNNLEFAVQQAGGPIGDLQSHKVWNQLGDKEEIRIVEHGEEKKVGGKSAEQIADSMKTDPAKLPGNVSIGGVTFQSCYAGVDGGKGSLVSDMRDELRKMKRYGVPVKGRKGIAFGFKGMGEATAKTGSSTLFAYKWKDKTAEQEYNAMFSGKREYGLEAYCEAMWELQNEKTKISKKYIFRQPFSFCGYCEPFELLGVDETHWNQLDAGTRSERIASEMEDYWGKVKQKMQSKKVRGFKKYFAMKKKVS